MSLQIQPEILLHRTYYIKKMSLHIQLKTRDQPKGIAKPPRSQTNQQTLGWWFNSSWKDM